jgi:catechol 2,3-dioxygenase-like lactoylglutathione lyase family enzyme
MTPLPNFQIENICPILYVRDMAASLRFYIDILGFKNAEWGATILHASPATTRICTYVMVDKARQARGFGSVLTETSMLYIKHSNQKEHLSNFR